MVFSKNGVLNPLFWILKPSGSAFKIFWDTVSICACASVLMWIFMLWMFIWIFLEKPGMKMRRHGGGKGSGKMDLFLASYSVFLTLPEFGHC